MKYIKAKNYEFESCSSKEWLLLLWILSSGNSKTKALPIDPKN
jgi:hypothetical protein